MKYHSQRFFALIAVGYPGFANLKGAPVKGSLDYANAVCVSLINRVLQAFSELLWP